MRAVARTYPVACSGVRQRNFDYFEKYLNGWAHKYLSDKDKIRLNEFNEGEGKKYCEVFDPEYIRALEIKDFLGYFVIRNVLASKTSLETLGRVMHKLVKWMHEKDYMAVS